MPDYEGYTKSLEVILDGVKRDYWCSYIDVNRHQVGVGRTYLWVSAALLGVYAAGFERFGPTILEAPCLATLGLVSFALACIAFGVCLYAIPARKGYRAIPARGWGEFTGQAHGILKQGSSEVYAAFLTEHINKIDHAFAYNFKTNQSRARLLRHTSWLLISSFAVAIVVAVGVLVHSVQDTTEKDPPMSEEENNQTSNPAQPAPSQPELNVPEPPPPADIGGGHVSTHSEDPQTFVSTFTTESDHSEKR